MSALKSSVTNYDGYMSIVDGLTNEDDVDLSMSDYKKFNIRMKSFYLLTLYQVVEDNMPHTTFMACCEQATVICANHRWKQQNKHTLQQWHQQFREKELFSNPLNSRDKDRLPVFLQDEDVCKALRQFCRENIATLTAEAAIDFVYDRLLPQLASSILSQQPLPLQPPPPQPIAANNNYTPPTSSPSVGDDVDRVQLPSVAPGLTRCPLPSPLDPTRCPSPFRQTRLVISRCLC